ncbi:MAG: ribosome hibernation-promoting factor, HPF/YfiA family [Elusimicrobiota bacterium]
MKVNVTARHLELTPSLKEYAEKKVLKLKKFTERITQVKIILDVEKERHIVEILLNIAQKRIAGKAVAGDMYAAIDLAMDKVTKQLKKKVDKMKEHKNAPSYSKVANLIWDDTKEIESEERTEEPKLDEVRNMNIKTQTTGEALNSLQERKLNFWVYKEKGEDTFNIVYTQDDGSYGMMILQ